MRILTKPEQEFTAKVINAFEPSLHHGDFRQESGRDAWAGRLTVPPGAGVVVDAEGDIVAVCKDIDLADVVCTLLGWAAENYPFTHPDDPDIVTRGLGGPAIPAADGPTPR